MIPRWVEVGDSLLDHVQDYMKGKLASFPATKAVRRPGNGATDWETISLDYDRCVIHVVAEFPGARVGQNQLG